MVTNVTTPANFFHMLRRQMAFPFRKPLIVMSPKSMLRHPLCVSPLDDLVEGRFQETIGDSYADPKKVKKVLLCTGKLYYELLEKQQKDGREDVAIIRVEQLHPFPKKPVGRTGSASTKKPKYTGYKRSRSTWVAGPSYCGCTLSNRWKLLPGVRVRHPPLALPKFTHRSKPKLSDGLLNNKIESQNDRNKLIR